MFFSKGVVGTMLEVWSCLVFYLEHLTETDLMHLCAALPELRDRILAMPRWRDFVVPFMVPNRRLYAVYPPILDFLPEVRRIALHPTHPVYQERLLRFLLTLQVKVRNV